MKPKLHIHFNGEKKKLMLARLSYSSWLVLFVKVNLVHGVYGEP